METGGYIDLAELRAVLTEDFDTLFINRVIMCLRTDGPGGTTVRVNDIRPLLEDNISRNAIDRIVMGARLSLLPARK